MKKLFALLAVAALVVAPAQAKIFGFGVAAGVNITQPISEGFDPDPAGGWYAGFKLKATAPMLGLGVDGSILYSQEALSLTDLDGDSKSDRIAYISVPIDLRYELKLPIVNKVAVPFLAVGPQFNYNVKDLDFKMKDFVSDTSEAFGDAKDAFSAKNASWRLNFGIGAVLINHLEVSYTYGLPLGHSFKENFKQYGGDMIGKTDNLKTGIHRVGVAWYF